MNSGLTVEVKPYTKKDLANLYEVSTRCLSTMLQPFKRDIGEKSGWYYNVNQVKIIFEKLGAPNIFLDE